jgi:hypothetical protein
LVNNNNAKVALNEFKDVSDYVLSQIKASESDVEDEADARVAMEEQVGTKQYLCLFVCLFVFIKVLFVCLFVFIKVLFVCLFHDNFVCLCCVVLFVCLFFSY